MNRKTFLPVAIAVLALFATAAWWLTRSPPAADRTPPVSPENNAGEQVGAPALRVANQLAALPTQLRAANDAAASRRLLENFRQLLASLPAQVASREIQKFLSAGTDAPTRLDIKIGPGGVLEDSSSLRVFLLDCLGRVDRPAAGVVAAQILANYTTPDEWAVCLRNYAWANPGAESEAYLQSKVLLLLNNPAWVREPSTGFLEAFDTIVYARGTSLVPELGTLVRDPGNRATAHAAYLTLDRLTINEPAIMLKQLVEEPALMAGREQSRASLVARADVRDPAQRAAVERYLLDPARTASELSTFAGVYPNANYMISQNLLTTVATPTGAQLAAHDREALKVIEQWLADPRFEPIRPHVTQIRERLAVFVRQAERPNQ
ncbi:MAG TPA: hypothetical protein VG734_17195 [Lacunisphaera sp.]|nr:hypothetical protein [Lacunisphaera sp.]